MHSTNTRYIRFYHLILLVTLLIAFWLRLDDLASMPPGISTVVEYSNDGGTSWTYVPVSGGCAAPAGYDRCVNNIRWLLQNDLTSTPPDNSGTVQFVARIR